MKEPSTPSASKECQGCKEAKQGNIDAGYTEFYCNKHWVMPSSVWIDAEAALSSKL